MKKEQISNMWMQGLLMGVVVVTAVSMIDPVLAETAATSGTIGDAANQSNANVFGPVIRMMGYLAYLIGSLLFVGGIVKLHAHSAQPTSVPLAQGLARLACGGALLAMPSLVGMLQATGGALMTSSGTGLNGLSALQLGQ